MVIKIAICDDQETSVSLHEKIVMNTLRSCGMGYKIATYTQSGNLLCDIVDDRFFFDLILLDIEMPGTGGMEIPHKIKSFLPNVRIIFVTSYTEYAVEAFELEIFRYVPKGSLENKLPTAVVEAARLVERETDQEYIIQTVNRMEKIPYREIFYVKRDGKNAKITSGMGDSKVRKSLQQVFRELGSPEFIFIGRGCIINVVQVVKLNKGRVVLKNGEELAISRSHLQEVKSQISRFWSAHI